MRPPTEEEKREYLIRLRPTFIPQVTKGKKTKWEELTFWEKQKVKDLCEIRFNLILW